jgi:large subunit ribosomal protein L21
MDYAIIKLGNKQHRVRDGETLVVDRLPGDEGSSFEPVVLLGEGTITATVISHGRGPKIVVGKYRRRTGYKRHNGFRAATTEVEISLGGGARKRSAAKSKPRTKPDEPTTTPEVVEAAAPEIEAPAPEEAAAVEETPVVEQAPPAEAPAGLPEGYEDMTVAQITAGAKEWGQAELEAALAYEQAHAARKGAITALEHSLAKEDGA